MRLFSSRDGRSTRGCGGTDWASQGELLPAFPSRIVGLGKRCNDSIDDSCEFRNDTKLELRPTTSEIKATEELIYSLVSSVHSGALHPGRHQYGHT